jgi:predicted anti-sigma-YlaC factor YlaD
MAGRGIQVGMDAVLVVMRPWVASHEETQERLSAYLEGELEGREHRRVVRHLALCPICREVLRTLAQTLERLQSLARGDTPSAGPSVADAVVERIRDSGP